MGVKAWLLFAHASLPGARSGASLLEDRGVFSNAVLAEASLPFLALAVKRSTTVSLGAPLVPAGPNAVVERPSGLRNDGGVLSLPPVTTRLVGVLTQTLLPFPFHHPKVASTTQF